MNGDCNNITILTYELAPGGKFPCNDIIVNTLSTHNAILVIVILYRSSDYNSNMYIIIYQRTSSLSNSC